MKTVKIFDKIAFSVIFSLCMLFAFKARSNEKPPKYFATFTVIVKDTTLLNGTILNFQIQTNNINSDYGNYKKNLSLALTRKISRIVLPLFTKQNYVRISQLKNGRNENTRAFEYANSLYVVESGDHITLNLSPNKKAVIFKGKNAAKYNCAFQMGNLMPYNVDISNRYTEKKQFQKAFEHSAFQHDSIFRLQIQMLKRNQKKIDDRVYQLMYSDLQAYRDQRIAGLCWLPYLSNKPEQFTVAKELFNSYFKRKRKLNFLNKDIAIHSYLLGDCLVYIEQASIAINKSTTAINYFWRQNFGDLDSAISNNYRGILRDKLMLISFLSINRKHQPDYIYYLKPAIVNDSNNLFKEEIIRFSSRNDIGHSTFNFALQDTSGEIHELKDYKGKLVVIDFWFTGCQGCLGMAPIIKSFSEKFKSNPNIVFLTISVDRNKKLWKNSVYKEVYCGKDEMNLIAENAEQSEIITYFNIIGYPALIVFGKDGTLLSAAPPDPRDHLAEFSSFLKKYLN